LLNEFTHTFYLIIWNIEKKLQGGITNIPETAGCHH